jgi:arylsulfatase A-like enzyme
MEKRVLVCLGCLLVLVLTACRESETPQPARPNILFAIADDWSWPHAGAYGDRVVKTPTFDRVANEGILFNHAFVASPSCTPSRAAILTGQWHWRLEESANLWSTLRSEFPVYPDLLEDSGYFVGYTRKGWGPGKFEVGGRTRNPAGTHFEDFEVFLSEKPEGKPFCFWFGSIDPHRGYEEGSGIAGGIPAENIELMPAFPDSPEIRSDVADYYWEVQRFDQEVGSILDRLRALGELDNTLVVITSDNGMPFPRCKGNLYDGGVRVPLAMRWPAKISGRRVLDDFVSLTDLAPTFLEVAGLVPPDVMTGRSLVTTLFSNQEGLVDEARGSILFGKERHVPVQEGPDAGGTPMRGIRTYEYLYIRNFRPDRWPAGTPNYEDAHFPGSWYGDVDNGPTKSYMVEHQRKDEHHAELFQLAFEKRPGEELYDLRNDPGQLKNLAGDSAFSQVKSELEQRLMQELHATQDPRALGEADRLEQYPYYGGSPLKPGFKKD